MENAAEEELEKSESQVAEFERGENQKSNPRSKELEEMHQMTPHNQVKDYYSC